MRKLTGISKHVVTLLSIALVVFQMVTAGFGVLPDMQQRAIHLFFVLTLVFLLKPAHKKLDKTKVPWYDIALSLLGMATSIYVLVIYDQIIWDPLQWVSGFDKIFAIILVLLILEASRRTVGWVFPIMAAVFFIYTLYGEIFPGTWAHRNMKLDPVLQNLYHTTNGVWGTMVGLSATMLAMFGIFGEMLSQTGGSLTFIKLGQKLTGKTTGGPGKVALIASGLFGMISGSAMANVMATGTFTIPMMKKAGYSKEWSASISAVGSTGGQIMPPIMGAGAFIMAQLIGVSYLEIATPAIVPALLYYMGAFIAVHYVSKKLKIFGETIQERIGATEAAIITVPLALFIALLAMRYTVTKAALYATLAGIVTAAVCFFINTKSLKATGKQTLDLSYKVATSGAQSILSMAGLLAGAQITISLISLSGFGVKLASVIVSMGQGNLFLVLLLSMVVCFILGMGLPTTAAYVLAAAVLAPALIQLGLNPLIAHLFVFYFSTMATITPPVCAAVFLSSGIAESNWLKTGGLSCLIAIPAFIVPYTFAYNEALMLRGGALDITISVITALLGVYALGVAIAGFTNRPMNWFWRTLMFLGGVALVVPNVLVSAIGLAVAVIAFFFSMDRSKTQPMKGAAA